MYFINESFLFNIKNCQLCYFFRTKNLEFWTFIPAEEIMKIFTIFLAFVVCATLVWITEAEECGPDDRYRCGDKCHGVQNTCKCGNQSWKGRNITHGCCPSSPDSCIKDKYGKTIFKRDLSRVALLRIVLILFFVFHNLSKKLFC